MTALLAGIAQVLHLVLALAMAPVLLGVVRAVAARLEGRAGSPVLAPWRQILRGLGRPPVENEGATWIAAAAPAARLGALVMAAALVPGFTTGTALAPLADLLLVAGLLALARVVGVLGWMDAGTAASGQLAAGSMARAALAEPALLLAAYALALAAGSTNLALVARVVEQDQAVVLAALLPLALALLAVVAADCSAGGAPDASGRQLALAEAGDALRLMVWLMLVPALLLPPPGIAAGAGLGAVLGVWLLGGVAWAVKLLVLAAGAAVAGAVLPRPAARHVGTWLGLAALAAVLGVLLVFAGQGRA